MNRIIVSLYEELSLRHIVVLFTFHLIITFSLAYLLNGLNTDLKLGKVNYNIVNNFIALFFSPVKEELKYRWFIGKKNSKYILGSISIIIADMICSVVYLNHFHNESYIYYLVYFLLIAMLSGVFYMSLKKTSQKYVLKLENWSLRNNLLLVAFSIILFAVWHGITYNIMQDWNFVYTVTITLISALFFSLIRVKFGIVTAMIYHFSYNTPIFLINNFI